MFHYGCFAVFHGLLRPGSVASCCNVLLTAEYRFVCYKLFQSVAARTCFSESAPRNDGKVLWMVYRDRNGRRIRESTNTNDWQEAQRKLRERLQARDDRILDVVRKGEQLQFADWADFFLENYSKPPIRAEKTHEANQRAALHLKEAFRQRAVGDIAADDIEHYLRRRLQTRVQFKTAEGVIQKDRLKPATVHQELRVLRRMLNVAVRKRLLPGNPCSGVEFPVKVKGMFRPHCMSWSEQQRIEFQAPDYMRNIIRIISESGLRCTRN